MFRHRLNKNEIAPGLNKDQVDSLKADLEKALKPYEGRELTDTLQQSIKRTLSTVMHKHRRSPTAPVPEWLVGKYDPVKKELKITVDWDRMPKSLDHDQIRESLGLGKWD